MSLSLKQQYYDQGLSPKGTPINPKHFDYRWKNSVYYENQRKEKEKHLVDLKQNWTGKFKTCKTCNESFPLCDEFWVKNGKYYRTQCSENANGCHKGGGKGFKSSSSYKKTQKSHVLQSLLTKNKAEDAKKGRVSDLDMEWMIEQEKKGDALAKSLYGIDYLPFSYEDPGKGQSNPMGPSLDRIDSDLPHTKDNCQLVWRITHLGPKNTTPEWRNKVYNFLSEARNK